MVPSTKCNILIHIECGKLQGEIDKIYICYLCATGRLLDVRSDCFARQ